MFPTSGASLPSVQWERFEGPLDLLLDEVRRQNVAIEQIAMAPIVSRFLDYMRTASERSLNLDIDWLHMAATLIHWKSRSLLPADGDGQKAEPDPVRDSLVQQLLAHRKEVAGELGRRRAVEEARISRPADGELREGSDANRPQEVPFVTVWDMIQESREMARWVREHREERKLLVEVLWMDPEGVTVGEMIEYLRSKLSGRDLTLDGAELLQEQLTVSRRCCLFLGMLEMAREQQLQIEQKETFGPILLTRSLEPVE
jgi:segregation and condensation protein A